MSSTTRVIDPRGREWTVRPLLSGWRPMIKPVAIASTRFGAGRSDQGSAGEERRRRRAQRRENRLHRRRGAAGSVLRFLGVLLMLPFLLIAGWVIEFVYFLGLLLRALIWLCCVPLFVVERLLMLVSIPLFQAARYLGWARSPIEVALVAVVNPRGKRISGRFDRERFLLRARADVAPFIQAVVPGLAEGNGLPAGPVLAALRERFELR
ncbi:MULTISPECIES: hypothetical protein [Actinoalloteichus]|uniref:Uncharacterized protein n=1 Tax=Actinoalloteichus fjordicus TaxID=1612552 RepID=A0AAC9LIN1_9PSEU|nr:MULTISPECIES: hypothetical protein [Actinoalloteichus]APU17514.1 hypothetical protein UA74_27555 [Actinoalloteichus fjordicus]APU23591.1 hypothetical protein UA75_28100 [Actinoalloteichus sp. GBA129-24]